MFRAQRGIECAVIALAVLVSGLAATSVGRAETLVLEEADLMVSDISWSDMYGETVSVIPVITSGQPYAIHATIENIGRAASSAFTVLLFVDGTGVGDPMAFEGLDSPSSMTVTWDGMVMTSPEEHSVLVSITQADEAGDANPSNDALEESFVVAEAEWTIAVYMCGDCNLEYYGILDVLEMAVIGTTPQVNVVVQFDRAENYDIGYDNWTGTKRFLVSEKMEPFEECAYEDLGETNMGDPGTLSDFAADTFDRFRSERTCLVLWGHGRGWRGGCCVDDLSQDSLTTADLRAAMLDATAAMGAPMDIVAFDSCSMGTLEVAYALEDVAVDFVGSMAPILGWGFPYEGILAKLLEDPSMEREQLCEVMVSEYVIEYIGYTALSLSAFRVDELCTSVKTALSAFADRLLELGPSIFTQVELARHFSVGWDVILTDDQELLSYSADLYMFAGEAAHRISDSELDVLASNLMAALEEARISFGPCDRGQSNDGVFGMVVFWPEIPVLLQEYGAERLSVDTSWDEFLLDYYSV